MTRKDYVLLSAAFNRATSTTETDEELEGLKHAAYAVALALAADNHRFELDRFIADCGVLP